MLVLSRRLNQSIVIGGEVRVTVLAISPSRVELGVEAPRQITVDREEIHLRRQRCRIPAATDDFPDAEELKTKILLALAIKREITARGWSQVQAAEALSINQPKVSALLRYRVDGFSVERLMNFLTALGHDVEIVIKPRRSGQHAGRILVEAAA